MQTKGISNAEVITGITGQITSRKFMSGLRLTDKDLKTCGKQACLYIYIIHTY